MEKSARQDRQGLLNRVFNPVCGDHRSCRWIIGILFVVDVLIIVAYLLK